jgi:hypothetical protein
VPPEKMKEVIGRTWLGLVAPSARFMQVSDSFFSLGL